MKASSAKSKGRILQQHIARTIVAHYDELEADDVVSRPMGSPGVDLMMSPKAQVVCPLSVESKNTKKMPGPGEWKQADYNKYTGTVAVVAWKPPRYGMEDTMVMLKFTDLLDLLRGPYGKS